jgi:hypothetical protein
MNFLRTKPRIAELDLANPLTQGLVFCVPLNEGGGGPRDIISKQYATVSGPNTAPSWTMGKTGPAITNLQRASSNPDAHYVFANNPSFEVGTNFTFAALAYQATFANHPNTLIEVANNFDFSYNFFDGQGNDWFSVQYWDGSGNIQRLGVSGSPSTNVWRMYAFTVKNSLPANIYYDGVVQGASTGSASGTRSTTGALILGGTSANTFNWGDKIAIECIWNRVLSPAEILSFSRDPYQLFKKPVSLWGKALAGGTLFTQTLTDSITLTDTLTKRPAKVYTEILTLTDTVTKAITKVFAEVLTLSDVLTAFKTKVITLLETITISDTFTRTTSKVLSEVVTVTDSVAKKLSRTLTESFTLSDIVTALKVAVITLTETITISDSLTKLPQKVLAEALTMSDTVSKAIQRTLTETVTMTDTVVKRISKFFTETISISDVLTATKNLVAAVFHGNKQLILDSLGDLCTQLGLPRLPTWNTTGRPSSPKEGTFGYNIETNAFEIYANGSWH